MSEPGSAQWWMARVEQEGRRRPRRNGLTVGRILDAALAIVDAEGLAALTMRRLAAALDCGHSSLYRHVVSQREVVVLLVDRVLGEVAVAAPGGAISRASAEQALRRYRSALLAHPALAPAFLEGELLGPNALARREEGLSLLLAAGVPTALAVRAYLTLTHFVIASAVFQVSGSGRSEVERHRVRTYFADLPGGHYPTLKALAAELNAVGADQEFELGLQAMLDHVDALAQGTIE